MYAPTNMHDQVVKCILRYLKGTLGLGIKLVFGPLSLMFSYSDADKFGCPNSWWSTIGFYVYLDGNILS